MQERVMGLCEMNILVLRVREKEKVGDIGIMQDQ
jgi:hypothetical protein